MLIHIDGVWQLRAMQTISLENSVGIVEEKFFHCCEPPNEMVLENGAKLGPVTIAYETYGQLNENKDNVVLILHALTGDHHAAGFHSESDRKAGWWDIMIGPDKPFDTNKYFVVCSNVLGSCKGTIGPSSIDPKTGKPYATHFPFITIADMVHAQKMLIDYLGIEKILCVAGGSMGGMQVLQWARLYPEMVVSAIPIATTAIHSAQNIALNEVGRHAIISDPNWNNGEYYDKQTPDHGLAVARMIGHISYLSERSMHEKFGRKLQDKEKISFDFNFDFQVESYLRYQGFTFTRRFDANSYLYITKALDYFDLTEGYDSLAEAFHNVDSKFLVIAFSGDWLYPPHQSKEIVKALKYNGVPVSYCVIQSDYGHDAFLLENEQQSTLIRLFLDATWKEVKANGL